MSPWLVTTIFQGPASIRHIDSELEPRRRQGRGVTLAFGEGGACEKKETSEGAHETRLYLVSQPGHHGFENQGR